jgi:urate oxidase
MTAEISYGKWQIPVYRTHAAPLHGIKPIPESAFAGRSNTLFAAEVGVEVFGDNFMPAYTHGDNSNVVATDTMKNFVLRQTLDFDGSTLEEYAGFLGEQFLATYPHMESLRITTREQPFEPAHVPAQEGFAASDVLFSRSRNSYSFALVDMERDATGRARITDHRCGLRDLQLIKITGSAFARFHRDQHTTLPERTDRPLYIYCDAEWRYTDPEAMRDPSHQNYIAAEQVRDLVQVTFHTFVSMSIQHLLHEIGHRLLASFPQMAEVAFEAQNRLWDTACTSDADERLKVYTDPRPPYGLIRLRITNTEL